MAVRSFFLLSVFFLILIGFCASVKAAEIKEVKGKRRRVKPTMKSFACAHQCTCYPDIYIITCQAGGLKSLPPELPTGDVLILNLRDNLFKTLEIDLADWPQLHLIDLRGNLWLNCTWLSQQKWGIHVQSWCDDSKGSGEILDFLPSSTVPSLPNRETVEFEPPLRFGPHSTPGKPRRRTTKKPGTNDDDETYDDSYEDKYDDDEDDGSYEDKYDDDDSYEDNYDDYVSEPGRKDQPQKPKGKQPSDEVKERRPVPAQRYQGNQAGREMSDDKKAFPSTKKCATCIKSGVIGASIVIAVAVTALIAAVGTRAALKAYRDKHRRPRNIVFRNSHSLSNRRSTEASLFDDEEERVTNERDA